MEVNPISQIGNVTRQYNEDAAVQRLGKGVQEAQQHAQAAPTRQPEDTDRNRPRRTEQTPKPRSAGGRVDTYA